MDARRLLAALLVLVTLTSLASADPAKIRFDAPHLVACRPLPGPSDRPGYRIYQATIHISTMVERGGEKDLVELLFRLRHPEQEIVIVDYLPRTKLESRVAGNINIESKKESTRSAGLTVTGSFESLLRATGSADAGQKNSDTKRFESLPELDVVTASGTIDRASGVYFKFRPSPTSALVGGRDLQIAFEAPVDWRHDTLTLECKSTTYRKSPLPFLRGHEPSGQARFAMTLYVTGDEEAVQRARQIVATEKELRRKIVAEAQARSRQGSKFGLRIPGIPSASLNHTAWMSLIYDPTSSLARRLRPQLPDSLAPVADKYLRLR